MARMAADFLAAKPISRIIASPLLRTRQTAQPLAQAVGIDVTLDERVIEGANQFQGSRVTAKNLLSTPSLWPRLRNPFRPSWGERYRDIAARMMAAVSDAEESVESGDVVIFSHQLPIWMTHRYVAGVPLPHFPSSRRCTLGSVTTFARIEGRWREVDYQEPAKSLLEDAIDLGAV